MVLLIQEISEKKAPLALAVSLLTFVAVCYFLIYYFNVNPGVVCLYIVMSILITEIVKDTSIGGLISLAANVLLLYVILGNITNVLVILGVEAIGDKITRYLLYKEAKIVE